MAEARLENSTLKEFESQQTSDAKYAKGKRGPTGAGHHGKGVRLLNQRQAKEEFGLTMYAIYAAVDRGELEALQVDGKGRVYYSEKQLRTLTRPYSLRAVA